MTFFMLALMFMGDAVQAKNSCVDKDLHRKDCRLEFESFRVHFHDQTILVHDSTWRLIVEMPIAGEKVEWESIQYKNLGGRHLVEILVWDQPQGEAQIQSLRWVVAELEKGPKLQHQVSEIIGHRRQAVVKGAERSPASALKDQVQPHGLELSVEEGSSSKESPSITWRVGPRQGQF